MGGGYLIENLNHYIEELMIRAEGMTKAGYDSESETVWKIVAELCNMVQKYK